MRFFLGVTLGLAVLAIPLVILLEMYPDTIDYAKWISLTIAILGMYGTYFNICSKILRIYQNMGNAAVSNTIESNTGAASSPISFIFMLMMKKQLLVDPPDKKGQESIEKIKALMTTGRKLMYLGTIALCVFLTIHFKNS